MTPRVLIEPARLAGSSVLRCQTDDRLVDLVRAGNDRAFEAIVDRYRRPLVRYCSRLLPPARAEDAVQQTFLNAFAGLTRAEQRIELRPWLYRVAHNAALNALRESGWGHERIETATHRPGGESAHDAAERRASLRTVLAAVQDLPERQRDAMILRELEGRSYDQIAVELDATGGAVRQLLNRARNTVRMAATAFTPVGLVVRLPWGAPVAQRVAEAASHDGLRGGAARAAGAVIASAAVAAGLFAGTENLPNLAPHGRTDVGGATAERASSLPPRPSEDVGPAAPAGGPPRLVRMPPVAAPRAAAAPRRRASRKAKARTTPAAVPVHTHEHVHERGRTVQVADAQPPARGRDSGDRAAKRQRKGREAAREGLRPDSIARVAARHGRPERGGAKRAARPNDNPKRQEKTKRRAAASDGPAQAEHRPAKHTGADHPGRPGKANGR